MSERVFVFLFCAIFLVPLGWFMTRGGRDDGKPGRYSQPLGRPLMRTGAAILVASLVLWPFLAPTAWVIVVATGALSIALSWGNGARWRDLWSNNRPDSN